MGVVNYLLNKMSTEAAENQILVTSNKSFRTYFNAAVKMFEGSEEKAGADSIILSGLGFAIYNARFATIVDIKSGLVTTERSKGRNMAKLSITLYKSHRSFAESLKKHKEAFEERQKNLKK